MRTIARLFTRYSRIGLKTFLRYKGCTTQGRTIQGRNIQDFITLH